MTRQKTGRGVGFCYHWAMRVFPTLLLSLTAACAGSTPATDAPSETRTAFENPGGMWMPWQLVDKAEQLRSLGLEIDVAALAEPTAAPLAAVVGLGGCSASFVSPDGLIITNHHCVQGALQYNSKAGGDNLVENGYLAATRADEKSNGPTGRAYVSQRFTDVTATVRADLDQIADPRQRYDLIETREKQLVSDCERDRPGIRCSVRGYFRGALFYLIENLELRDIRLVYAPHRGIGLFGGDEDNWMWPRQTGDYSFYRAYVGKDGKPADYSPDNVPYRPAHHLKVASTPLGAGDFVMAAGFPGRTNRYRTATEVSEAVEWSFPRSMEALAEYVAALQKLSQTSEDIAIKTAPLLMGLQNGLKKSGGVMKGLVEGRLLERKQKLERDLVAWVDADDTRRSKYGTVLAELRRLDAEQKKTRDRDADMGAIHWSSLLKTAGLIVRMAEERPKPDAERDPWLQERNWKRLEASQKSFARRYNRDVDRTMLTLGLERAARHPDRNRDWLVLILGDEARTGAIGKELIERVVTGMYQKSKLEDDALRLELLRTATTESLKESADPFIQLALGMRPLEEESEARDKRYSGAKTALLPTYIAALREFHDGAMAPDANGTLRVTYGTVRGFRPTPQAPMYQPFTTLSQMIAKHRDADPFDVPDSLLAVARSGRFGDYVDAKLGEIPVNFLTDLDITGGNSGSPTLNARGELVGLAFDTNLEAVASDWLFMDQYNRTIHVDIRYVLWIMDAVDGAHHLLREMGVEPQFESRVARR